MKIFVSLLPTLRPVSPSTDTAVVIDVLRATSVMATALANGAERIATCEEIEESQMVAEMIGKKRSLLCGERGCRPIKGFDLGNSPGDYKQDVVDGRALVLTTTNGTHAIAAAGPADQIITASFLNLDAVAEAVTSANELHLVCAGTAGFVTAEDTLLAGALIQSLFQRQLGLELIGDEPILAHQLWRANFGDQLDVDKELLAKCLANSQGGRNLIDAGYQDDLRVCAELNSANVVPQRVSTAPSTFALTANRHG